MAWWQRLFRRAPVIGTVVGEPIEIRGCPAAGCLGGPLVFDLPTLTLELASGDRVTLEAASRVVVEGAARLPDPPRPAAIAVDHTKRPPPSGPVYTVKLLTGRVEVLRERDRVTLRVV